MSKVEATTHTRLVVLFSCFSFFSSQSILRFRSWFIRLSEEKKTRRERKTSLPELCFSPTRSQTRGEEEDEDEEERERKKRKEKRSRIRETCTNDL